MDAEGNAKDRRDGGSGGRYASRGFCDPEDLSPAAGSFLASLAGLLIQKAPPEQIASLALETAKRLTDSPHGYVGYVDPASGRLVCPVLTEDVWERCRLSGRKVNLDNFRGLLGWVREHRQPLLSNEPAVDPRAVDTPPGHLAIERLLSVPVLKGEALLGQISVANAPRDYAEGDLANLERLAELFALALRRSLDEMELERTCRELDERVLERSGHLAEADQRLRREADRRLRAEQDLEGFFNTAPDILAVLGPDGRVKRVSPSSEKILGLTPAEMIGALSADLLHPDDRPALAGHLDRLAQGERVLDQELRLRRADGSWVWLSWSGMRAPDGRAIYVVGRDISRRKGFEQALKESETLFRQMFETNRSMKLLVDPADGSIVRANRAACDFYGYGPEEFSGKKISEINMLTPEQVGQEMEQAAREERLYFEFTHRLASGELRQVEVYSGPVTLEGRQLLYSIVHDITARKLAEQALKESEEKFAKAFQAGPVLMVIADLADGRLLEVNDTFVKATGYARQELVGRTALELGIWGDPRDRQTLMEALRQKGSIRDLEVSGRRRDGGTFSALVSAERVRMGGRNCFLGVAQDISERKMLEDHTRQAQKRESLAAMAGGVAHDFNNLLQTILGNADLALMDTPPASPVADNLREVQGAAQRAAELAHKMLAYSGHTPFIPRTLDLSELVRQALPLLRQGLPSWIGLEQDLAAGLPGLEGDQALLRQALQNLVTNAVEALEAWPGTIGVSTGLRVCDRNFLDSTYLGHGLAPGEYLFLRVEDTGPGMDRETASKAFDPFFTTKFPGRGLGLAVVLGAVRSHNGAVRIEPRPGGGNRVSLFLPVAQPAPARSPAPGGQPTGSPLVLLVDDEEAVRLVARRMLERHGFAVITAEGGGQALEILRQRGGEIGTVLLDLNMPGLSGESLVRRTLALAPRTRVVVASSLEQNQAQASLGECAIAGFIQKPYRMAALIELLRRTLKAPDAGA